MGTSIEILRRYDDTPDGKLDLAEFRQLLARAGLQAEFAEGMLIVNASVTVRKHGPRDLSVEALTGPFTEETIKEHPLVYLLLEVLKAEDFDVTGTYDGHRLRPETLTFSHSHTSQRDILIGHGKGKGLGKLWSTREADIVMRYFKEDARARRFRGRRASRAIACPFPPQTFSRTRWPI